MQAARTIRDAVAAVSRLRATTAGDAALADAVRQVKRLQSRRFRGTYADLLRNPVYASAAAFFLQELYGEGDYSKRDAQFARIAGAIERFFPAQVADTAASLARLHALTEDLDIQMAHLWSRQPVNAGEVPRYVAAWRELGRREERERQLESVLALGHDLARLTRTPGLRTMLKMMRGPAAAAGLSELQRFLEAGFDTFATMARTPSASDQFLAAIEQREGRLLRLLDEGELVACETELARILGQAP